MTTRGPDHARVNILMLGSDAGADRDRHPHRLDDRREHRHQDRPHGAHLAAAQPAQRAPRPPTARCASVYPSGELRRARLQLRPERAGGTGQCMLTNLYVEAEHYARTTPGAYPAAIVPGRQEIRARSRRSSASRSTSIVVVDLYGFAAAHRRHGRPRRQRQEQRLRQAAAHRRHTSVNGRIVGVKGYFEPGRQHLDGYHALWYARSRAADNDTYRQMRQRCVVQAIVEQVNPAPWSRKYPEIAQDRSRSNIYTDIPAQNLPAFVDLVERVQKAKITSVALTPAKGSTSAHPDYDAIRTLVKKAIARPEADAATPVDDAEHAQAHARRRRKHAVDTQPDDDALRAVLTDGPRATAYAARR